MNERNSTRHDAAVGCICIAVISILLGIIVAVLFAFGFIPAFAAALPFIFVLAIFVLALLVLLILTGGQRNGGVHRSCLRLAPCLLGAAIVAILAVIIALAAGLAAVTILAGILVFILATTTLILLIGTFLLIHCLIRAGSRSRERDLSRDPGDGFDPNDCCRF